MHEKFSELRKQLSRQRTDYYTHMNRLNADEAENIRRMVEDTIEIYFEIYAFKDSVQVELKKVISRNLEYILKFPANLYKGHRAIEELKDNKLDYLAASFFRRWDVTMSQIVHEYVDCQQGKQTSTRCRDVFDFDEPSQSCGERFSERLDEPWDNEGSRRLYDDRRSDRYDEASESRYDESHGISEVDRDRK
jgi:hypothetical protein